MTTVRTRFAPSPTGALHLGNVRVAVFNWLFTRHHDGRFVLRVEDTDVERTRPGSEAAIREDLRWLGLEWDEGPDRGGPVGPYRQSERLDLYRTRARALVDAGRAYPCYCTPEELEREREAVGDGREVLRYSGRCRDLDPEERRRFEEEGRTPSIRFATPRDGSGEVEVEDEARGTVSFPVADIDDFVLLRSDGRPTYNFAVVVDDDAMEISHVIRGAGHLSNTHKQALLYDALGRPRPRFAHLPTVLSPDGGKLSKREDAAAVADLRREGYHPDGVVNYLSLLGWSSPDEREDLSRGELVERISLDRLGVSDTVYDPEKLRWLSGRHIERMTAAELRDAVRPHLDGERFSLDDEALERAAEVLGDRLSTFAEINERLPLLYPDRRALESARSELKDAGAEVQEVLGAVRSALARVEPWEAGPIMEAIRSAGRTVEVGGRALFHPVREAVTAASSGPKLGSVLWAVGRETTLRRLDAASGEPEV